MTRSEDPSPTPSAGAKRNSLSELSGHTAIYLIGSLAAKLASLLLLPVFTPLLTTAEYGVLELTDATLALLLQLVGFQIDAALMRHYLGAADHEGKRRVVGTAFCALLVCCLVATLPLFLAPEFFARLVLDDASLGNVIRLTGAILIGIVLAEVPLAVLKAERRSLAATGWQLARLIAELSLKIAFVVSFGLGAVGVLLGQALPGILFLVAVTVWLVRRFGLVADGAVLRSMVSYSAPMVLAGFCQFALHSSDRYLFRWFSTLSELGCYGVAYKLGYAVTSVVLSAFLLVWYPFVFALEDEKSRVDVLSRAALFVPAGLVLASLPVALFAPEIVGLLTDPEFHGAWKSVPIVCFAYLFWGLFQVVQTPFYVASRTRELPRVVATAALANVMLNVVLLPILGGIGAALATVGALVLLALLSRRAAQTILPYRVEWKRLAALLAPCAIAAVALYGRSGEPFSPLIRAAILVVLSGWLALGFLRGDERDEVIRLFARFRGRGSA